MGGVREERFEGLVYHQGVSIRYERVKASNSCAGTLIFGSFFFIVFYQSFFFFFSRPFFLFFLSILLSFLLLSNWFLFLSSFVFPLLFRHCFIPVHLAHVLSSLAYLNLLGTKRLNCCCCCCMKWGDWPRVPVCKTNMHTWVISTWIQW
jgi:hypothetical protein